MPSTLIEFKRTEMTHEQTLQLQLLHSIHPTNEPMMRSLHSALKTQVTFMNVRASPVNLWWKGFDGKRVSYGSAHPNAPMEMTTYVTHPWVITDEETDLPLGIWIPTVETGLILIN